jgi:hypothetical protein
MILISHRGNLNGPSPDIENKPEQIEYVISKGFYVEIDVWYIHKQIYLGHDEPQYKIDIEFLNKKYLFCHAKNIDALEFLILNDIICFSHNIDDVVLTSNNLLWTYPGKKLTKNSICVLPEIDDKNLIEFKDCYGICTDYIYNYLFLI